MPHVTQGLSTGCQRNLANASRTQQLGHNGMSQLVDSYPLLLFMVGFPVRLLAHHDLVDCEREMALLHLGQVLAHHVNRSFVHHALKLGTGEAISLFRYLVQVNLLMQRLVLGMQIEDGLAALLVRHVHLDMTVKAAGAQQRRIQHLLAVRCRNQQDARRIIIVNSIHLRQQLIERLIIFTLLSAFAFAADDVNFIDKNNRALFIFLEGTRTRIFEQIAHTSGADSHIHFNELAA
ncbi:hypothetical protein D3C73_947910 [compost metagenome]